MVNDFAGAGCNVDGPDSTTARIGCQDGLSVERRETIEQPGVRDAGGEADLRLSAGFQRRIFDAPDLVAGRYCLLAYCVIANDDVEIVKSAFCDSYCCMTGGKTVHEASCWVRSERIDLVDIGPTEGSDEDGTSGANGKILDPGANGKLVDLTCGEERECRGEEGGE